MSAHVPADPGDATYLALTTFRRDGRAVTTPVWPVAMAGRIYVGTTTKTGKYKRIRATERVRFAPCNHSGRRVYAPWREGRARVVEDPAVRRAFLTAVKRKYGWVYYLVMSIYWLRGLFPYRIVLEIKEEQSAAA